jgi:hypothetical protein
LNTLKGALKRLLFRSNKERITEQDLDVINLSEKELHVCSILYTFLKKCIPPKETRYSIAGQIPLIHMSNILFTSA